MRFTRLELGAVVPFATLRAIRDASRFAPAVAVALRFNVSPDVVRWACLCERLQPARPAPVAAPPGFGSKRRRAEARIARHGGTHV